jgi:hypothetical protein
MRLAAVLVSVTLLGSVAVADDAKPADPKPSVARTKVPLRVVRILPETHQALLFDKNRGTHVLADVGGTVEGYTIEDIADDEVTLTTASGAEVVLAAPDQSWRRRRDEATAEPARPDAKPAAHPPAAKAGEPAPVDPYAASTPVDPYADPVIEAGEVRTAEAPMAGEVRTAEAPMAAPASTVAPTVAAGPVAASGPAPASPAGPAPAAPTTSPATPPAPTAPTAATDAPVQLARAEVTAALGDFGKLTSSIRGAFTPTGVRVDAVTAGSLFARAGLLAGDVITAVDNQPLRSLDDAASLYARAASTKSVSVQVQRAGKPATLRIAIQ